MVPILGCKPVKMVSLARADRPLQVDTYFARRQRLKRSRLQLSQVSRRKAPGIMYQIRTESFWFQSTLGCKLDMYGGKAEPVPAK